MQERKTRTYLVIYVDRITNKERVTGVRVNTRAELRSFLKYVCSMNYMDVTDLDKKLHSNAYGDNIFLRLG